MSNPYDDNYSNPWADGSREIPDGGGYGWAWAITDDGESLCPLCISDAANPVHPGPTIGGDHNAPGDGWRIDGWFFPAETDGEVYCAHCNREA